MKTITIKLEVSDQLLDDTIINAIEGNAIGYWAEHQNYSCEDEEEASAEIRDHYEDEDDVGDASKEWKKLNRELVLKGIQKILSGEVKLCTRIYGYILEGVLENNSGHIDGEAQDAIIQAGLLGEIVYG